MPWNVLMTNTSMSCITCSLLNQTVFTNVSQGSGVYVNVTSYNVTNVCTPIVPCYNQIPVPINVTAFIFGDIATVVPANANIDTSAVGGANYLVQQAQSRYGLYSSVSNIPTPGHLRVDPGAVGHQRREGGGGRRCLRAGGARGERCDGASAVRRLRGEEGGEEESGWMWRS